MLIALPCNLKFSFQETGNRKYTIYKSTKVMAVGRKSAVATKGNWFLRRATQPSGKSPSALTEQASRSSSTPIPSRRQRRSNTNKTVTPTPAQLGKQLPKQNRSSTTPKNSRVNKDRVPVMPNSESAPLWLLRLHAIHRNSSIVAFLLVAATLVVYGWTVYSQELWSQAYHKLQNLQRQDRQLTTTNEVLQNKMAVEGEKPSAGLVAPTPGGMIFINPASHSSNMPSLPLGTLGEEEASGGSALPTTTTPNSQTQQESGSGLGY